jgi:hypothetical protein
LHKPSLDDVFLVLTGHAAEDGADEPESQPQGRRRKRRQEAST